MSEDEAQLGRGFEAFNRGDIASADAIATDLLSRAPRDARVVALAGMAAYRRGDATRAIPHLRAALPAMPDNEELRAGLVFALFNADRLDEARAAAVAKTAFPRFGRVVALIDYRQGRYADAVAGYHRVLAALPEDQESWANLGLALAALEESDAAIEAFGRAITLRPDLPEPYLQLDAVLASLERHDERRNSLRVALVSVPNSAELWIQLGLAEGAADAIEAAEAAYSHALSIQPDSASAFLEYGMLLDRLNRLDELDILVVTARSRGIEGGRIDFLEAWAHKRRGRFANAIQLAERAHDSVHPARFAQLIGESADRLGDADRAFAAFEDMNTASSATPAARHAAAQNYIATVAEDGARLTPAWGRSLVQFPQPTQEAQDLAFIMGFPRSGTTLLDTLLMNLPELIVLEERPMIERIEEQIGGQGAIPSLAQADVERLRRDYFTGAEAFSQGRSGSRLVDKFPLHMVRVPTIHRLFPDAPLVFVERHPCDVVLSCFMARFQTNRAMVQFTTLLGAARLYDAAMNAWTRAQDAMPLRVHRTRYERLVGGAAEEELRALLAFLDLPWHPEVLDNETAAARRGRVETASYTQVGEPIYTRAVDRWKRYREHLAPVIPVLAPWVERLGYAL